MVDVLASGMKNFISMFSKVYLGLKLLCFLLIKKDYSYSYYYYCCEKIVKLFLAFDRYLLSLLTQIH